MKTFKIFLVVLLLIVANLYLFNTITFNIKYKHLVETYNKLEMNYKELEDKYLSQEKLLNEYIAKDTKENLTIKEKISKILDIDSIRNNIGLENIKKLLGEVEAMIFR
ncbi:MAG: hypothetical protein RRZ84_04950 [Romboutsia sp.]